MATYKVTAPDGRAITINGPDGATDEQIKAKAQELLAEHDSTQPVPAATVPDPATIQPPPITPPALEAEEDKPGILDYLLGVGELGLTVGTGAVAEPLSGLAGLAGLVGGVDKAGDIQKKVSETLTYLPKTEGGQAVAGAVGKGLQKVIEPVASKVRAGADVAMEKTTEAFGPTAGGIAGAAVMTAAEMLPELLGLKGTRAAKRAAIKSLVKDMDVNDLYDQAGTLKPKMVQALKKANIAEDEFVKMLPERVQVEVSPRSLEAGATQIGKEATRAKPSLEKVADFVQPKKEVLDAAKELGVEELLLPSHIADNNLFVALEKGLKDVPGSSLSVREADLIKEVGKKADEFITEFGGDVSKSSVSDAFRGEASTLINNLEKSANLAYEKVSRAIPKSKKVLANNTVFLLKKQAKELGGEKFLDSVESKLLNRLIPSSNPTYARLDKARKSIGQALRKNTGPFKDADEGALKQLYGALSADQMAIAKAHGVEDLYKGANSLVATRKGIEGQLQAVLGKQLTGAVMTKARSAVLNLSKGDTKAFDELAKNIPKELGPQTRKAVFVSALNEALTSGSRAERQLNVKGFNQYMNGIAQNATAKNRLVSEIGQDAYNRMDALNKVTMAIEKSSAGKKLANVPAMFDTTTAMKKLLGGALETGARVTAASAGGLPAYAVVAGMINFLGRAKKTRRSLAATELMASPKFLEVVSARAAGALDTADKLKQAERVLEETVQYKKWKNALPGGEKKDLAALGLMTYLTKPEDENNE